MANPPGYPESRGEGVGLGPNLLGKNKVQQLGNAPAIVLLKRLFAVDPVIKLFGEEFIKALQGGDPHFFQGGRVAKLFILAPDGDGEDLFPQVDGLRGCFKPATGDDSGTMDEAFIEEGLVHGLEMDMAFRPGLTGFPGENFELIIREFIEKTF